MSRKEGENESKPRIYQPRDKVGDNRMNSILMAVMEDQPRKMNQHGSLTEKDIPRLCEEWMRSCEDIMKGAPERLPPLRDINHHIPLVDEKKRYKYHNPRCLDSLKPKLAEKIARYTRVGWWEQAQAEQAAPMLCVRKKTNKLRTVIDG